MEQHDRWFVIVNPVSGGGKGLADFPKISRLLRKGGIEYDFAFTKHQQHATKIVEGVTRKGFRKIIVVGGDGTLNEVVNGILTQTECEPKEILLGVISVGTGNDWVRSFSIPRNYKAAVQAISEGHSYLQDVGKVTINKDGEEHSRYMANVMGLGFDAYVLGIFDQLKRKGWKGKWLYIASLLRGYISAKAAEATIEVDGKVVYNRKLFSLAAGICRYNGGGIQQLPRAVANDGLLDVTIIRPVHWWHVVFRAARFFNGNIYSIGHIEYTQGKSVKVTTSPAVPIEVDGELHYNTPVTIDVVPEALRVIVPKAFLEE